MSFYKTFIAEKFLHRPLFLCYNPDEEHLQTLLEIDIYGGFISMKIIISPAKNMKPAQSETIPRSLPAYLSHTQEIIEVLRTYSPMDLEILMRINPSLALDGADRIQTMKFDQNGTAAIETYDGIQYKYMKPLTFSDSDKEYAQKTIRILSGAYGILKPYDSIYEYRLEMLTKLNVAGTKNLYEYWSDLLYQDLTASDDLIVNLASEEYAKCIRKYVKAPVRFLTCSFKVRKNGVYKTLATAAKMARGQMVHYIITNRISDFEKLKEFDTDGYFYEPSLSSDSEFVFLQR